MLRLEIHRQAVRHCMSWSAFCEQCNRMCDGRLLVSHCGLCNSSRQQILHCRRRPASRQQGSGHCSSHSAYSMACHAMGADWCTLQPTMCGSSSWQRHRPASCPSSRWCIFFHPAGVVTCDSLSEVAQLEYLQLLCILQNLPASTCQRC